MELGKHIKKGIWGFLDKSLPLIYGFGFVVIVMRVLDTEELGTYLLIQNILFLLIAIGSSFALQPMVKFSAETNDVEEIISTASFMYLSFIGIAILLFLSSMDFLGDFFNANQFSNFGIFLPIMLLVSYYRNIAVFFFQSKINVQKMFWTNASYFLMLLIFIGIFFQNKIYQNAYFLFYIHIICLIISSFTAFFLMPKNLRFKLFSLKKNKSLSKNFWDYGKFSSLATTSYTFYTQADSFVIASILNPSYVAIYAAARIFSRIYDVILQMLNTFLVPTSAKLSSEKQLTQLEIIAEKFIFIFSFFTICISIFFLFFADKIIFLFYGNRFSESIPILRIISIGGIFYPLIGVASSFLYGIGKMKEVFFTSFFTTVFGIIFLVVGTVFFGLNGSAFSYVLTAIFMSIGYTFVLIKFGKIKLSIIKILSKWKDIKNYLKKQIQL